MSTAVCSSAGGQALPGWVLRQLLRHYIAFLSAATDVGRLKVRKGLKMAEHVAGLQKAHDELAASAVLNELNYSSAVIALYGALERFGEGSVADYVQFLNSACPSYGDLPDALRRAHFDATVRLLQSAERERLGSAEVFVSDLNSCMQDEVNYRLTPATFFFHTANFRHGVFNELWNQVGVENVAAGISNDAGYAAAVDTVDPGGPEGSFFRFDDIAERRNEIAHGIAVSELLSLEYLGQYVDIVDAFATALRGRVTSAALGILADQHGVAHNAPIAVYNNEIVCLACRAGQIAVGDLLIGKRPDGGCRGGRILEIQVESTTVPQVDASDGPIDVGLRISFHAKDNYSYWSLPQGGWIGSVWQEGLID
jgi:hypothetical protein